MSGAWGTSDTAATVGNAIFPPSGVQTYRCTLEDGLAPFVDVDAATGDEAATLALRGQPPKAKVSLVDVAPQRPTLTVKKAA